MCLRPSHHQKLGRLIHLLLLLRDLLLPKSSSDQRLLLWRLEGRLFSPDKIGRKLPPREKKNFRDCPRPFPRKVPSLANCASSYFCLGRCTVVHCMYVCTARDRKADNFCTANFLGKQRQRTACYQAGETGKKVCTSQLHGKRSECKISPLHIQSRVFHFTWLNVKKRSKEKKEEEENPSGTISVASSSFLLPLLSPPLSCAYILSLHFHRLLLLCLHPRMPSREKSEIDDDIQCHIISTHSKVPTVEFHARPADRPPPLNSLPPSLPPTGGTNPARLFSPLLLLKSPPDQKVFFWRRRRRLAGLRSLAAWTLEKCDKGRRSWRQEMKLLYS